MAERKNIQKTHVIDARGKSFGRVASEAAALLRGKHRVSFVPYKESPDAVIIINAAKVRVSGRKIDQKLYWRHTGYIGHIKLEKIKDVFSRDPREIIRRAVWGMLAKNKLRVRIIKKLKIYVGEAS